MSLICLASIWGFAAMLLPAQVPTYTIRTVAGTTPPSDGGFALNAVFAVGMGKVTTDSAGNVYIAESSAGKVHRVGTDGVMTLVAGGGTGSTPALQATLSYPYALAVDSVNNILYIGGLYYCAIQRVDLKTGAFATIAGTGVCNSSGPDGPALTTPIFEISGLALDSSGGLLFSEVYGYRVRRLDLAKGTMTTIVGTGSIGAGADGLPATQTALGYTGDVALDSKGDIFVLDAGNCVVRKIDAATSLAHIVAGTLGQCGYAGEGVAPLAATLDQANGITVDAGGDVVYIAEGFGASNRIRKADLGANKITTFAGTGAGGDSGDGGPAIQALITVPRGLALNSGGILYFTEYIGARVRLIDTSQRVQAFAGVLNAATGDGGPALAAVLNPFAAVPDGKGGLVISDDGHYRVRAVSNGVISLVAGTNAFQGSSGDGGPATSAGLFVVYGMAVDPAGPVYISQGTGEVRVISGGIIRALSSISFNFPNGLALDPTHRFLYIAEYQGDRIVSVDVTTGLATTIAGIGTAGSNGTSGDDGDNLTATQAHLNGPGNLATDASGNVYVVDANNHVIRKINPSANTMVTVAGNHQLPSSPAPDGGPATSAALNFGGCLTVDSNGNIFFSEGSRIRRVDAITHTLSTVAGTGVAGFSGDGGPALSAQLSTNPSGMSADSQGNIYFADNNRIRVLSAPATKPRIDAPIVAASFGGGYTIASGTWMEIYGEDLSPITRQWAGSDFNGNQAPNSLSGVEVLINGKQGYIDVISPGQINAQVPDGIGTGNVSIQVVSPSGTSDPVVVTAAAQSPALLAPPSFTANGKFYAAGILSDGSFVGPTGLIPGAAFRPAHAGETVVLYGIGFGSGTGVPAGTIAPPTTSLPNVTATIGGLKANLTYAGQTGGFVGLFQFNVVIPSGLSGDVFLAISVNGVPLQQVLYLTVQ
jgi:uncharacterized protein (TIGR03437 family)